MWCISKRYPKFKKKVICTDLLNVALLKKGTTKLFRQCKEVISLSLLRDLKLVLIEREFCPDGEVLFVYCLR